MRFAVLLILSLSLLKAHPAKAAAPLPQDSTSAVILAYQNIGQDNAPENNLRIEQFNDHLDEIKRADYNVIALPDLITALKTQTPLPEKTIVITFEGALRSAYENGMKPLLENNIPFTVFFSSSQTEYESHLDWKELRALSKNKNVTLGILPANYNHITPLSEAEQKRQINKGRADFAQNVGMETAYFSYPFGEVSNALKEIVKAQSFEAAFGLQSGPAFAGSDIHDLPRFSMTESYGDLERFRMITKSLPLPVTGVEPQDSYLTTTTPAIGFTLPEALQSEIGNISCFISNQEKPQVETIGPRVEIRAQMPLDTERTRINCTLPAPKDADDTPRWRWFGMLLDQAENNEEKQTILRQDVLQ